MVNNGYTFHSLHVVGNNQDNQQVTWADPDSSSKQTTVTKNYWWQGTVLLTFYVNNVGYRGCIIDPLNTGDGGHFAAVTYNAANGCSGGMGSSTISDDQAAWQAYHSMQWAKQWDLGCVSDALESSGKAIYDCIPYVPIVGPAVAPYLP